MPTVLRIKINKHSGKKILTILFCFLSAIIHAQQSPVFQIIKSQDNSFRMAIPAGWAPNPNKGSGEYINYTLPGDKDDFFPPKIVVIVQNAEGDNIETLVAKARSNGPRNVKGVTVLDTSYVSFNNKEWFEQSYIQAVTKKNSVKFKNLETIYNGKFYQIIYQNSEKDFDKYKEEAFESLHSFMFLNKDVTPGAYSAQPLSNNDINTLLGKMKGVYKLAMPNLDESYISVTIDNTGGNGNYFAKATEAYISHKAQFNDVITANLKVKAVDKEGNVQFVMDEVTDLHEDGKVVPEKKSYTLKLTDGHLAGSQDGNSGSSAITLYKEGGTTANSSNTKEKATTAVTKKNNVPVASSPDAVLPNTAHSGKTHPDEKEGLSFDKEPEYISTYGDGKVQRLSEHQIQFTLTTAKQLVLKDPYNAKTKSYENPGIFIGYTDDWNSFILFKGDGSYSLVNRTTGELSDPVLLSEIEQKENITTTGPEQLYTAWSPDKKWLAVERSPEGEDEGKWLVLYSTQPVFKKKYEKLYTIDANIKSWEPGKLKWLGNVLEVEQVRPYTNSNKEKVVGSLWFTFQNGKFVPTNNRPVIKDDNETGNTTDASSRENHPQTFTKRINIKPDNINTTPAFTGSIIKHWQVAAVKNRNGIEFKRKTLELEFLGGGKFNSYENGVIQGSGTFVLATDKKSALIKGDGANIPMKIERITNDDAIFNLRGDELVCFPANSPKAKVFMQKRDAYFKLDGKWSAYRNVISSLEYGLNGLESTLEQKSILPQASLDLIKADMKSYDNIKYNAISNYMLINDYMDAVYLLKNDVRILNDMINGNETLRSDAGISSQLNTINEYNQNASSKEDELIQSFNEYFKY